VDPYYMANYLVIHHTLLSKREKKFIACLLSFMNRDRLIRTTIQSPTPIHALAGRYMEFSRWFNGEN
jgi:hypothetical protein